MKILWLNNIILPKIAENLKKEKNNMGGWLVGVSNNLSQDKSIELNICFPIYDEKNIIKGNIENINYFAFPQKEKKSTKYNREIEKYLENILEFVKPDVIHIWGTEYAHTLAMVNSCRKKGIIDNVVVSIQGLCSVIEKHYYANLPYNIINKNTIRDFIKRDNIKKQREKFNLRGNFEIEAIKKVKHVIGRTDWDKACVNRINSKINYYFCNETLRDAFYENVWELENCEKYSIFVSQCNYPVKGFHLLLEAMPEILKVYPKACIYTTGMDLMNIKSIKTKLKLSSYQKYIIELITKYNLQKNIVFLGNLDEKEMCDRFLKSHIFISPSSIENSSNSIAEAMILGVPTISSDVGGVKNMMRHDIEGFIYQYDAPYMIAYYALEIFRDNNLARELSGNARKKAMKTHNRRSNLNRMIEIYKNICMEEV